MVKSNFFIYRTRVERHHDTFAGERKDTIRSVQSTPGLLIARRRISFMNTIVLANNMSTRF